MKLTPRDIKVLDFLEVVQVAECSSISKIFFNNNIRSCQRRLKILFDNKYVKRVQRVYINQEYIYYINKKPSYQMEHKLYISRLVSELSLLSDLDILKIKAPLKIDNVISDGFLAFKYKNKFYQFFIEVELTKDLNVSKYTNLLRSNNWRDKLKTFPNIIAISNKKFYCDDLNIINIKKDFSNIDNLF